VVGCGRGKEAEAMPARRNDNESGIDIVLSPVDRASRAALRSRVSGRGQKQWVLAFARHGPADL